MSDLEKSEPNSQHTEYLVAWISQGLQSKADINIYGNPEGLRRLASMLSRVADYDQSNGSFPDGDSLHCHLSTGLNTTGRESLPRLTLGRVDSKDGSEAIRMEFPELDLTEHSKALSDIRI